MERLLHIAQNAAREAGTVIMELYTDASFEIKKDGSPVTSADRRANDILLAHLSRTNIPVLSEESVGIPVPYPDRLWIIDPLDGTKDFLDHNGDFCVMVALLEYGRPTVGVVYAPAHDTLYYGEAGAGAYTTHKGTTSPLCVSDRHTQNLRCLRSIHHFTEDMHSVAKKLDASLHPRGSVGIKAGILSLGEADFFYSRGKLGEWDVCAPEIILTEAGGRVTDCAGKPIAYGNTDHRIGEGMLFSNGACHEHVLSVIQETPPTQIE